MSFVAIGLPQQDVDYRPTVTKQETVRLEHPRPAFYVCEFCGQCADIYQTESTCRGCSAPLKRTDHTDRPGNFSCTQVL